MTEYLIQIDNNSQATALVRYLKSLDFVKVKPANIMDKKAKSKQQIVHFLENLPDNKFSEEEMYRAIKSSKNK